MTKKAKTIASKKIRFFSLVLDFLLYNDFLVFFILVCWLILGPLGEIVGAVEMWGRLLYFIIFVVFYLYLGLSPANKILNFKIVKTDGKKYSFKDKLFRMSLAVTLFSFLSILSDRKNRGLHDLLVKTEVHRLPSNKRKLTIIIVLLILIYFIPILFF